MDKTKKYLSFLIFPLLFLLLIFPSGKAHAATDVTDKVKIENLKISVASTGSETEGIYGANDTSMGLKYSGKFSFPNVAVNEIKEGDYFVVKAPDNLNLVEDTLDLIDSTSNIKMGTVQADNANHRLVFTFSDMVKDKMNIRGDFVAKANESLSKDGKTVTYVLPDGKTQVITYKVNTYNKVDVIGETISKYGYNDPSKARAHFQMKINRAKQDMTGHVVKITDDISKGAFATYIEGTFLLNEAEFETTNTNSSAVKSTGKRYEITTDEDVYQADSDNKALLRFTNGKRGFELLMPTNMGTKSFFLTYDSTSPADTSTISNSAQYLIDNEPQLIWKKYGNVDGTKTESTFNVKTVKSVGATVAADITGKIKITKFDEADATVKLDGVVFEIVNKNNSSETYTVTTDENGVALSPALSDGQYIVKEKTPKAGYVANSQEFEVEIKDGKGVPLNISNKRETVDFEATKTWANGKATDYKEVKLALYVHKEGQTVADSKRVSGNYTPEVTQANGVYTYKWKNQLPGHDVDGNKLIYSVRELQDSTELPLKEGAEVVVGENNYVVSYDADKTHVTNTHTPAGAASVTLGAKKVLEGKTLEAGKYSFELKKADGSVVETVTNAADGTVTFAPISYDESQVGTHKYTISEVAGSEPGVTYDTTVQEVEVKVEKVSATELKATASKEAKDLVFKNVYTPAGAASVTLGAKKVLEGKTLEAGKYSFELKKEDGTVVETATNAADGTVTFSSISYDESQVGTHKYTISEVAGSEPGVTYDTTIQEVEVKVEKVSATELKATASKEAKDLVFKNVYTPAKTSVSVKKAWDDKDNQDGKRPSSITVKLLADGQETNQTLVLNVANNWAGSFTNLDTDKGGASIKYTVVEEPVTGYTSEVTGDATSGFIITNTYTPETVDVTVTKNWNDNNDQDGKRPSSITVNLLADGTKVDSREIQAAADGTWTAKFEKLAKYKDGKEIKYAVTEESVVGYKSFIDNFTITNSHDPEKINISGTKVWNDNNDQDGKRPTKITVQVLKGEQVVAEVEVSAETDWKFEFKDLPKYEKGKEITYKLKEVSVEHYTTEVTDKDGKYTITNTHTPAKINVKGQKIWDDANNKDGIRPDSIVVKLLANGVETGKTATASAASGWTYEFTDLDRYQDGGKEIVYAIKEAYVPKGYTSEVIGTNIVNHHKPKDPEPNKPQDPEPNKPKDPEPGKPGQKPQLPNTGEKASNATVVAGLALMVITGGLYFVSRKNK
ncbi:Cna B-type domain-containing protein [Streptococcus sp. 27098_8_22]|uniref:Cna B-type domain-containing protein n=1 Tax=Streptococcus sp. 27098_8_22 TaxID=3003665 RepID=UPI00352F5C93